MDEQERDIEAREAQLRAREQELDEKERELRAREESLKTKGRGGLYDKVNSPIPVLNGIILALLALLAALFVFGTK